jgi:hypothetical protein
MISVLLARLQPFAAVDRTRLMALTAACAATAAPTTPAAAADLVGVGLDTELRDVGQSRS